MVDDDKIRLDKMVAEYERLKKVLRDLDAQSGTVDQRLVEIERRLPEDCIGPEDRVKGQP